MRTEGLILSDVHFHNERGSKQLQDRSKRCFINVCLSYDNVLTQSCLGTLLVVSCLVSIVMSCITKQKN